MRYVGLAALVATFWLLVATVRLIVHDCASRKEADVPTAVVSGPTVAREAPPVAVRSVEVRPRDTGCDCDSPRCKAWKRPPWHNDDPFSPQTGNPIAKSAVVAGMNCLRPFIAACYQRYQVPGVAMVNVVIAKSGRVLSATTTGKFAGTPTGACVERAVWIARFPPSDGLATPYPFYLR